MSKRFLRKVCVVVPTVENFDDGRMSWHYGDLSNGKGTLIVMGASTYEEAVSIATGSYGKLIKL